MSLKTHYTKLQSKIFRKNQTETNKHKIRIKTKRKQTKQQNSTVA